jgi:hypothetical protein
MVFPVVELTDPIADTNGSFDASSRDFLAYSVSKDLLTQVRHDWLI